LTGAQPLWERYFKRLLSECERRIGRKRLAMHDGDDLAATVLEALISGTLQQRFPKLRDREQLWMLLLTISARKVANARRDEHAQIRGGGNVVQENVLAQAADDGFSLDSVMKEEATPEMAEMLVETLEYLGRALPDASLRRIAELKMEEYTNQEIANAMNVAKPTVERKLGRIKALLREWSKDQ
jgi:DNA-directed RNA polymerase specialized sigma24 family protein